MSMNESEKRVNEKKAAKVLMEKQRNQKKVGSQSGGESNEYGVSTNELKRPYNGVINTRGGCV